MRRLGLVLALACFLSLTVTGAASGWSNGPSGANSFGTHDWVLQEANRLAASKNCGWVKLRYALPKTDDPDTVLRDFYYHIYDIWGSKYGDAPKKIAAYYAKALKYRKQGNYRKASEMVGIMAHYYADICNPLHTDQCDAEEAIHSDYELAAQEYTDSPGENSNWVRFDGYRRVRNVRAHAVSAAKVAHYSYRALVSAYATEGMNDAALRITRQSLNRAANGLADLIINLRKSYAAGTALATASKPKPQPGGATVWVGITETGSCYHRLTCRYYTQHPAGNRKVTLAYAKSQGYRPCSVCRPPQ